MATSFFGKLYTFRRRMGVTDCMLWNPSKHIFLGKVFFTHALFFGSRNFHFPMEEYMESQSSIASQFLYVDGDSRIDSEFGQLA